MYNFLKAEALFCSKTVDDVVDVVAAVKKHTVGRNGLSVDYPVLLDFGDVGKTRKHALAVDIAKSSFNVVF